MDGNIIEMKLNKGRTARTSGLYQYDYGQKLQFSGAELPVSYEVHFSNAPTGESKTMIGDSTGVEIPDEFLLTGLPVYVWVYLHDSEDDGETEYAGVIDVISRAQPTNDEPTPVQQDTITQAIAALQSAVVSTGQDAADASAAKTAAEAAQTAAQAAQTAAETAQGKAETAQAAAEAAAATAAADAAEAAVADVQVDVAEMVTAAQAAQTAAEAAQGYAEGYATAASTSEGNASDSATAASGSASSAGNSADAAAASALKAEGFAVGKQNSIDVESGSPYYENNAKYYAGVAEDAATALTDFIDDTAGDGDTDKVWSADKTVRLAPIEDPEFTGSITLGSRQNTKGNCSFASGYQVSATGDDSHAEGSGSYAAGDQSHAEGVGGFYQEGSSTYIRSMANGVADHTEGYQTSTATRTNAIGGNHAEGYRTKAHYGAAHAEGECTKAGERGTHAEGYQTIANCEYQHVQGKLNVVDNAQRYADIVGNGTESNGTITRSNASALEWNGTLHLKGDVYVGCNDDSTGGNKLATQGDVANLIDDTAGSGDTTKVWSADKSSDLLSALNEKYTKPQTGIPASDLASGVIPTVPVIDVQIEGASILSQGVANIPYASANALGLTATRDYFGMQAIATGPDKGRLQTVKATDANIKTGTDGYKPIVPSNQQAAVFYGLAKAAGADEKDSTESLGTYTENARSAISQMLNAPVSVSGTTPSITAKAGVRYICGECSTLTVVVPASGIIDVVFQSGSTPTVLTVTPPTGVTMMWIGADPTALEANKTYEVNIMDGCYGMVVAWT